jgi:hypothetical protein
MNFADVCLDPGGFLPDALRRVRQVASANNRLTR